MGAGEKKDVSVSLVMQVKRKVAKTKKEVKPHITGIFLVLTLMICSESVRCPTKWAVPTLIPTDQQQGPLMRAAEQEGT